MTAARKPLVGVWRDAIRDSELDSAAKLVALTLSTYMNGGGRAFPSQATIAAGCSLSDRAVRPATRRLEVAGFVIVERSRGRTSHRYTAALPATANEVLRSEWLNAEAGSTSTRNLTTSNPEPDARRPERGSDESEESVSESVTSTRASARGKKRHALRAVSNNNIDLSSYDL